MYHLEPHSHVRPSAIHSEGKACLGTVDRNSLRSVVNDITQSGSVRVQHIY